MRTSVGKTITRLAGEDPRLFLISGDAGYGVWEDFIARYPNRFMNLGVAEQNMISFGAGLAMTGQKVFIYNIIPFVLYRCFEQVRNDVCYQEVPVVLVGTGAGLAYAPAGMTHYSVEDVTLARTMPNLVVLSPTDPDEAAACIEYGYKSKVPVYIRVTKGGEPSLGGPPVTDLSKPRVIREGSGLAVVFHGSIGLEVLKAIEGMPNPPKLIAMPMLQPIDYDAVQRAIGDVQTVLTVEEHFAEGGLGTIMAEWMQRTGQPYRLESMGVPRKFIHDICSQAGMRKVHGIDAVAIRERVSGLLAARRGAGLQFASSR